MSCVPPAVFVLVVAFGPQVRNARLEVAGLAFLGCDPGNGQDALPPVTACCLR